MADIDKLPYSAYNTGEAKASVLPVLTECEVTQCPGNGSKNADRLGASKQGVPGFFLPEKRR